MPIMNTVIAGGGAGPEYYVEKTLDANGKLTASSNLIKLDGIRAVDSYVLSNANRGASFNPGTAVTFGDLESVTGDHALNSMFVNSSGIVSIAFDKLKTITGSYALANLCSGISTLSSVDMKNVETISGNHACESMATNTYNLSGFNLDKLKSISGTQACYRMFSAIKTTTISLPSLESVYGTQSCQEMFGSSTATTVNLPKLVVAQTSNTLANYGALQNMMASSTNLTAFNIPSLKSILGVNTMRGVIASCSSMTSLSFPAVNPNSFGDKTNQFVGMCSNIPNITLHFPSNVQSVIEGLVGYSTTAPFGAVAGTVLFDLPATVILTGANSQAYERSPKDDTATALAWRKQDTGTEPNLVIDWTPFYTSGTSDPTVGDTIYSDSACTTAVTTISSIA